MNKRPQRKSAKAVIQTDKKDFVEAELTKYLCAKMKERKVSLRDLSARITPRISHSALGQILRGKAPLNISRFAQICRSLRIDPLEAIESASEQAPAISYDFTEAQEKVICSSLTNYKIFISCSRPQTLETLKETFSEINVSEIQSALDLLQTAEVIQTDHQNRFVCSPSAGLSPFSSHYMNLLNKILSEMYLTTGEIQRSHSDLSPFIRNSFMIEYLTPEQIRQIQKDLRSIKDKIQKFSRMNLSEGLYKNRSQKNLMGVLNIIAPLNASTFINNKDLIGE